MNRKLKKEDKILNKAKDLQIYYAFIYICSRCARIYGTDTKDRINLCPICLEKRRGRKQKIYKFLHDEI